MAEYIDRKKYMKDKYNCDLIHIESLELVPLYQIIDRLEQSIEISKIDNAIKEMESMPLGLVMDCDEMRDYCVDILKRNIGE